jgi:hypothetical protein
MNLEKIWQKCVELCICAMHWLRSSLGILPGVIKRNKSFAIFYSALIAFLLVLLIIFG